VITEGTGKPYFKEMPFAVAGKTGTAHVADGNIKYYDMVYQASFVGYFPANDPQYTCIVVIRTKPHAAQHFGGMIAGPVFKEVATKLYAMYVQRKNENIYTVKKDSAAYFYAGNANDIKNVYQTLNVDYSDSVEQNEWSHVYANNYHPVMKENRMKERTMPNVKGMGLKDALYLLENMGLKVSVKGKGKIITQSVQPGVSLVKGITVVLELAG
jgi:cell division protein FtsI (penicillin-binding protein 3)